MARDRHAAAWMPLRSPDRAPAESAGAFPTLSRVLQIYDFPFGLVLRIYALRPRWTWWACRTPDYPRFCHARSSLIVTAYQPEFPHLDVLVHWVWVSLPFCRYLGTIHCQTEKSITSVARELHTPGCKALFMHGIWSFYSNVRHI